MDGFDILPCVKPLSAVMLAVKAVTGMQFAAGQITMTRDMLALDLMRDDFADAPLDPEMLSRLRSRIVFDLGRLTKAKISDAGEMPREGAALSIEVALSEDGIICVRAA